MVLRATHTTTYLYSQPVSLCHTDLRLKPRGDGSQRVLEHELCILPAPEETSEYRDYFGNHVTYFSLQEPHQTLTITAASLIEKPDSDPFEPCLTPVWEEALYATRNAAASHAATGNAATRNAAASQAVTGNAVTGNATAPRLDDYEFTFESPRITLGPEFRAYALPSFSPGRPLLDATLDLCHRIHAGFKYDRRATTVSTPVTQLLQSRSGVCQDFAHFTIACLRSLGLAARYVSGYLRSGDLIGGEASHAWVSVFCPSLGWLDLDPTNDQLVNGDHVTLAWGRDYSDVAPVNGVALGGGEHVVNVSVAVTPA
ncbi:MAG TPA: transglutaminase family protein [Candidatus Acidoferrales bacterium]|jgi:transglutaminase-like putative cysteine protease|nr:transglutaminase family protein [Candidatus Acidoferrales bacterium]